MKQIVSRGGPSSPRHEAISIRHVGFVAEAPIRYARAGEVNIAFQVLGDGSEAIVYVPGLLNLIEATAEVPALERHLDRITSFSTVVTFDKRGTGLSDRVPAA